MVKKATKRLVHGAHDFLFNKIHNHRLIYNACWEDPRIDRELLKFDIKSRIVMLTSAGCNALDYLLDNPECVHAIDVNPRQNALLELKQAIFKSGGFSNLFSMFGLGSHPEYRTIYKQIRDLLSPSAQDFWDVKISYFDKKHLRKSFYYHGTSGNIAWMLRHYFLKVNVRIKKHLWKLLDAQTLEEQAEIYSQIEPKLWNAFIRWLTKHPVVMAMVGVPRPQIQLIQTQYEGGLHGYVRLIFDRVAKEILMKENYFWRVYFTGRYTPTCCPNYLRREHFDFLRDNIDKIHTHTTTMTKFLRKNPNSYTHFILLDHQDWLAWHDPVALKEEWDQILMNAAPKAKILMRSASANIDFVPDCIKQALTFFPELTEPLHKKDRVGTYGSVHMAEVR